jgi:hypothetical protein
MNWHFHQVIYLTNWVTLLNWVTPKLTPSQADRLSCWLASCSLWMPGFNAVAIRVGFVVDKIAPEGVSFFIITNHCTTIFLLLHVSANHRRHHQGVTFRRHAQCTVWASCCNTHSTQMLNWPMLQFKEHPKETIREKCSYLNILKCARLWKMSPW